MYNNIGVLGTSSSYCSRFFWQLNSVHIRPLGSYPRPTRPVRYHEVEMPSRAVAYSPDGSKIAVGFGTPTRESSKQFDGKWIVLKEDDFQVDDYQYDVCHNQLFFSSNGFKITP